MMRGLDLFWKGCLLALALCCLFIAALCISSEQKVEVKGHFTPSPKASVPLKREKALKKSGTELTPDPISTLMVLATLDGTLTAVDRVSGELRWISKDEPMIKVPLGPTTSKAPYFLPDPKTGSLYILGRKNSLRKLPFTIPQLVAMAPCRNSEGLMYTGRKLDYWLTLNPNNGDKSELPSFGESTCPARRPEDDVYDSCTKGTAGALPGSVKKSLVIGKSEYTLSMVEGPRKWNVTYHHYSSVEMSPQSAQDYELAHFTSPSTGSLLTYDRETGQLLWQKELESPVIAVYSVDETTSNLVSVPFNPIASETLDKLKNVASQSNQALSPTTYIGESNYGLFAIRALVDDTVFLMASDGTAPHPPLLEGPVGESNRSNDTPSSEENSGKVNINSPEPQGNVTLENEIVIYGYYKVTDQTDNEKSPVMQITSYPEVPDKSQNTAPIHHDINSLLLKQYNDSDLGMETLSSEDSFSVNSLVIDDSIPITDNTIKYSNQIVFPPNPLSPQNRPMTPLNPHQGEQKEVKPLKIVFTTAIISVLVTSGVIIVGMVVYRKVKAKKNQNGININKDSKKKEKVSDSEEDASLVKKPKKSADGSLLTIGKICFSPTLVLGKGCEGTFVFKGKFEGRECAVKRILPECFAFADREVDLLKESDQHPNVIRYFCTESDGQFRYIALELCEATLSDWIDGKFVSESIDPLKILQEATDGLAYLHTLRIVHRDIKPANVLLSVSPNGNQVKTMISDFGLCKKITNGRMSFSRRSGGIPGTDGWIAPEVIKNLNTSPQTSRMSYSVDVFSLGCVYYFVLTNGDHPFGEPFRRQSNIVTGEWNLDKTFQNPQGIHELISLMISQDPNSRPPLSEVLYHPMFWPKDKILTFFLDVSDRIEKEDEKCLILRRLESDGIRIVRNDWRDHICPEVAMDLRRYRTYKGHSVRDLLRALRNKKNHYRELTPEAQSSLGHIPDEFVKYWISRFPDLLLYTWLRFESLKDESIFSKYYPRNFCFNSFNQESESFNYYDEDFEIDQFAEGDGDDSKLNVKSISNLEKSPKVDKNFWRSKSQFKYNKWRRQQQNTNIRENPINFTSFGSTRYPPNSQMPSTNPNITSPDMDHSWRNPVTKDKDN